jgi:hypothetical protein
VQPNYGYCSSNDPRVHFGLGSVDKVEKVLVHWTDGKTEEFKNIKVDAVQTLVEKH